MRRRRRAREYELLEHVLFWEEIVHRDQAYVRASLNHPDPNVKATFTARLLRDQAALVESALALGRFWSRRRNRASSPYLPGTGLATTFRRAAAVAADALPLPAMLQRAEEAAALTDLPPWENAADRLAELRTPPAPVAPLLDATAQLYALYGTDLVAA